MIHFHLFHITWSARLAALFSQVGKFLCAFIVGTIWTLIEPVVPMIGVCIFAMVADTISAWRLNRRCRVRYPQYTDGKLHSSKVYILFHDFLILFATIVLAHLIDTIVLANIDSLYLPNWIAAIYCCYQIISIIENESSCSDSSWAKLAQKVVANKIARHLDLEPDQVEALLHPSARPNLDGHPHKSATVPEASASGTMPADGVPTPSSAAPVPEASASGSPADGVSTPSSATAPSSSQSSPSAP